MLKINLKKIMDDKGYSIQDIYEKTGISRNTISLLYNGKSRGIQLSTLDKLLGALRVSPDEFFVNDVNYSDLQATIENDNSTQNILSELSDLTYLDDRTDPKLKLCFFEKNKNENMSFLKLPLIISQNSTPKLWQFECLWDDYKVSYQDNFDFTDIVKNVGYNKLEKMILRAFAQFRKQFKTLMPDSLKQIGFRTDLGMPQDKSENLISYIWDIELVDDENKIQSYLDTKYTIDF